MKINKTFFIDGGCSGNGQHDLSKRKMISVVTDKTGVVLVEENNIGGSNNIAEFIALLRAMEYAIVIGLKNIEIITDSMNNIAWFKSKKINKKINDYPRTMEVKNKIEEMKTNLVVNLIWKGRGKNLAGHYIESIYKL